MNKQNTLVVLKFPEQPFYKLIDSISLDFLGRNDIESIDAQFTKGESTKSICLICKTKNLALELSTNET